MKNINFMMNMVDEFLSGKISRLDFELDFNYELKARYGKMRREHQEYAEVFYDWLSEDGVDKSFGLSDTAFKRLISEQYNEVKSIAADGFC
jgi:hypothetical protein